MIASILLFGTFALPFAKFTEKTMENLVAAASLWLTMAAVSAAYGTMESSYIPLFMRESGWFGKNNRYDEVRKHGEEQHKEQLNRGSLVSVLGLIAGNLGSITSLLIGVIILHTSNSGPKDGYKGYVDCHEESLSLTRVDFSSLSRSAGVSPSYSEALDGGVCPR